MARPSAMIDSTFADYARWRVERIFRDVQRAGQLQVRLYRGHLRTYRFPAPRGLGTRGELVGVYTSATPKQWIEDDLLSLTRMLG